MSGLRRHGRPEGQCAPALQRSALPQAEDPHGHPRRFRRRGQGPSLRDDQRRILVGRQVAEPVGERRRGAVDREPDRGARRQDGLSRARGVRNDGRRLVPGPLDLLPAVARQPSLCLPLGARQRRAHPRLHARASHLRHPRRRAVDAPRGGRRRPDARRRRPERGRGELLEGGLRRRRHRRPLAPAPYGDRRHGRRAHPAGGVRRTQHARQRRVHPLGAGRQAHRAGRRAGREPRRRRLVDDRRHRGHGAQPTQRHGRQGADLAAAVSTAVVISETN